MNTYLSIDKRQEKNKKWYWLIIYYNKPNRSENIPFFSRIIEVKATKAKQLALNYLVL